jgi:hypothetical protein
MYEGATFVIGIIEKKRSKAEPAPPEDPYDPFVGKSGP